jgi:hypothetical protein
MSTHSVLGAALIVAVSVSASTVVVTRPAHATVSVSVTTAGHKSATTASAAPLTCAANPLQAKELAALGNFTGWLTAAHALGYVGEVGWPSGADSASWNAVANTWYSAADAAQLWVTAWSTGEWWGNYPLQPYVVSAGSSSVDARGAGARVLSAHLSTSTALRGVNSSGAEFGTGNGFSNSNPGALQTAYHYDSLASFQYLASQGVKIVRMPFRWERLQPALNGPLNASAVADLKAAVGRAHQAGLQVILDLHNYGAYSTSAGAQELGTKALPSADLTNFWSRFATTFGGVAGVNSFDLMNEPHDLASAAVWQQASEQALLAVRATGNRTLVMVEGYDWAGTYNWSSVQPTPWITDPANNFRYEAHQYFDEDWSGQYNESYSADLAAATAQGFKVTC